jgi:hypothetical protein
MFPSFSPPYLIYFRRTTTTPATFPSRSSPPHRDATEEIRYPSHGRRSCATSEETEGGEVAFARLDQLLVGSGHSLAERWSPVAGGKGGPNEGGKGQGGNEQDL